MAKKVTKKQKHKSPKGKKVGVIPVFVGVALFEFLMAKYFQFCFEQALEKTFAGLKTWL